MNLTVTTDPASEVAEEAIAGNACLVVLGETRHATFGADPHGGAIDHEPMRCRTRVTRAGHPADHTTITGRGRPTIHSDDASGGRPAMRPRDTANVRIDEMISRGDIVTLSDGDLAWLRPGDRRGDAIRWLMSRGPAILVVTHGHTAATGYTRSGSVHVRGHGVMVADTAEWEDAFVAGLLHALTARDLLARTTDRSVRSIGTDDLREILQDANLYAAAYADEDTASIAAQPAGKASEVRYR